jgi:hypothetical protein
MLWAGGSVGKIADDLADLRDREAAAAWGIRPVTAYDGHRAMLFPACRYQRSQFVHPPAPRRALGPCFFGGDRSGCCNRATAARADAGDNVRGCESF